MATSPTASSSTCPASFGSNNCPASFGSPGRQLPQAFTLAGPCSYKWRKPPQRGLMPSLRLMLPVPQTCNASQVRWQLTPMPVRRLAPSASAFQGDNRRLAASRQHARSCLPSHSYRSAESRSLPSRVLFTPSALVERVEAQPPCLSFTTRRYFPPYLHIVGRKLPSTRKGGMSENIPKSTSWVENYPELKRTQGVKKSQVPVFRLPNVDLLFFAGSQNDQIDGKA